MWVICHYVEVRDCERDECEKRLKELEELIRREELQVETMQRSSACGQCHWLIVSDLVAVESCCESLVVSVVAALRLLFGCPEGCRACTNPTHFSITCMSCVAVRQTLKFLAAVVTY